MASRPALIVFVCPALGENYLLEDWNFSIKLSSEGFKTNKPNQSQNINIIEGEEETSSNNEPGSISFVLYPGYVQ